MKEKRINFNKKQPIYLACSAEPCRPEYGYVYFLDGEAYATNGRIAVRVPISELAHNEVYASLGDEIAEALNGYAIHASNLKKIYSYNRISVDVEGHAILIEDDGMQIRFSGKPIRTSVEQVGAIYMPKIREIFAKRSEKRVPVDKIGLKVSMLGLLASAMGAGDGGVKLELNTERNEIFVFPFNSASFAAGIIMPMMLD